MSGTKRTIKDVYSAMAVTLVWSLAAGSDQVRAEGWVPVQHADLDAVFVEQDALLDGYHSIMLDPLSVWFGESATAGAELDATLEAFRAAYADAFTQSLSRQGFELVDEAGPGVLRIHADRHRILVLTVHHRRHAPGGSQPTRDPLAALFSPLRRERCLHSHRFRLPR